ncbi:sugar phosphate nucleotidyltransferase [Paenibacillus caui]|uniref:sugar phosphate nucleotidyltransferase n=1 Tax=Paenibacillus caui TaxID=2873927 RepID=UPI001CA8095E|nr:sugar phosphate nucleotidyltransferase [Paenibacillus caui]
MKIVVLSGGSGKRLWPLSNEVRSKQFLKLLHDPEHGFISMIQRIWSQLKESDLAQDTLISACKTQIDLIKSHLGVDTPLIVEPERRDTFPAIALAASYLYSQHGVDANELIVVMPVDPYVHRHFFSIVRHMEQVLTESRADIALIGVKPTSPSSKFGYIVPCKEDEVSQGTDYLRVSAFEEKPSESRAQALIHEGAIWNCGVFGFRLRFLLDMLKQRNIPLQYEELAGQYGSLPKISFDYEIVEKTSRIVAIPYEGDWKDLGSWDVLTEELHSHQVGKGYIDKDCVNTHVLNELDIPLVVLGLSNAIVAASPNGILVSDKSKSHRLKEILQDTDHKPRFWEYPWGWSRFLYGKEGESGGLHVTSTICIYSGQETTFPPHSDRFVSWMVMSGDGEAVWGNQSAKLQPGVVLRIPAGARIGARAKLELELVEVRVEGGA